MRATVTLDDDVAHEIRRRMRERGESFKATINELLRLGLQSSGDPMPYLVPTYRMQVRPDVDIDKALTLVSAIGDA